MQVRVRLMGTLRARTPPDGVLELADGATVGDALGALAVPAVEVQAVSVNGRIERDLERRLAAGDELMVLPPVSGGSSWL